MEKNEISNISLIKETIDNAINFLISQNVISPNLNQDINYEFGYIYTGEDNLVEALFKILFNDSTYYLAIQDNKLKLLNIDKKIYDETVSTMKSVHSCLNDIPSEPIVLKERREKNNSILKSLNITISDSLQCLHNDENIKIKDIYIICKHAIASLLTIQVSCDIRNGKYNESKEYFMPFFEKFNVLDSLNSKEKRIMDGTYTEQDVIDMDWEYEVYWSICWCLGLVSNIMDSSIICDCDQAISFVMNSDSIDDFISKCHIRTIQEILDMEDLYYRYNWAINEKKVNDNASIGKIDSSIVIERRRGLEWIISNIDDWYDINLSA